MARVQIGSGIAFGAPKARQQSSPGKAARGRAAQPWVYAPKPNTALKVRDKRETFGRKSGAVRR